MTVPVDAPAAPAAPALPRPRSGRSAPTPGGRPGHRAGRSRRSRRAGSWHAVAQFAAAGLLALAVLSAVGTAALERIGTAQALHAAEDMTAAEAHTVAPQLTQAVVDGDPAAVKELDRQVQSLVLSPKVLHVKLWDSSGRVLYADTPALIGQRFPLGGDELEALRSGRPASDLSDLSAPENRLDGVRVPRLLQVYLRVTTGAGTPLLFEAYLRPGDVSGHGRRIWTAFAPALLLSLVALELLQLPLAWRLTRRLQRGELERADLHRQALDASDLERRRIAADLHDGVVPTLTAVSYWLASAKTEIGERCSAEVATTVDDAAATTRQSIRALRTLLVDIYPDRLRTAGLEGALRDLIAPLPACGISPQLSIDALEQLPGDLADLLYRTAQEAVRNVVTHAGAGSVDVSVRLRDGRAVLAVRDDGVGLHPRQGRGGGSHLGLRLLHEAAEGAHGQLVLRAVPGGGTELRLDVPLP